MPRPTPLPPEPLRVTTAIRFPVTLANRIKAEAARRRISVNRLVEWGMGDWLNDHEGH